MPASKKSRVTLRDIARIAEVSVASVSLALRNSPRISNEKKEKIVSICEEVGYVKDSRLSQLMSHLRSIDKKDAGASIAAVISGSAEQGADVEALREAVLASVRLEAEKQGYSLCVIDMAVEGVSAKRLAQILKTRGIVGVVVLPSDSHELLDGFDYDSFHVVALGYELAADVPNRVCPNYIKMMDELMREVLRRGHRKVAFIPEQSQSLLRNRMMSSSIDFHLTETPESMRTPDFEGEMEDEASLRGWLSVHQPDLILGSRKAYERLVSMGYGIPADFSFAAWDLHGLPDSVAGLDARPDLMGKEAVLAVVDGINHYELGLSDAPGIIIVNSGYRRGYTIGDRVALQAKVWA